MPYTLRPAADAMAIAEQEYATAQEIRFTAFTSCIGVIARQGPNLTAVHLVMRADDDSPFDTPAVLAVLARLTAHYDSAWIIGCTDLWENPQNDVLAAFGQLVAGIRCSEAVKRFPLAPSTYGARVDADGDLELTYPG